MTAQDIRNTVRQIVLDSEDHVRKMAYDRAVILPDIEVIYAAIASGAVGALKVVSAAYPQLGIADPLKEFIDETNKTGVI